MALEEYLDGLFAEPGPGPATAAYREWEAFVAREQSASDELSADIRAVERDPWPTLHSLIGADAEDAAELVAPVASLHLDDEDEHEDDYAHAAPDAATSALLARLHRHLPAPAFTALIELLASARSDEELQLELVEILGFEGDALELVEAVLRPGVRTSLVSAERAPPPVRKQKAPKNRKIDITDVLGTPEDIERRIQEQLSRPKAMFVDESQQRISKTEQLPNVFTGTASASAAMSYGGKLALPAGTTRDMTPIAEEVMVPPPTTVPPRAGERPVPIRELPPLARGCFSGYVSLNRMQSVVQPVAMGTNENMLVCAPTGAGKTDVALMTIVRVLQSHLKPGISTHSSGFTVDKDRFKIVYVAPMKALAAEITRKFGKRLAWLGIQVRELTGDMQLSRQEIADTQIIVTTPEKWDVVTRKPTGEGALASKVRLLIIDEVHLLNEERGAVIETIVARTLRQVESSQSLIRIVGLSATLPNYIDVSDFLRVNRYTGLFFFDASFRPVPLEQHFIGVKGKPRSAQSMRNMDQAVFDRVFDLVREGHQVMVFVHARKETVKTAQRIKEMATEEGGLDAFDTRDHPKFQLYRRDIGMSRNKEMKELFDHGFGIHHAGMLRSDRNMMERMFEDNAIKVLCCTSTLAWGVNLPAHAVVIKGTQVYDSSKGAFTDLSVLDVLQIFGRAGRPGYETYGVGYICTTQDKLDHYLYSIMSQHPIESKFIPGMVDALNAEVALGTIANVREAISWIGYTYLFVRMRREPFIYGMSHDEPKDDPQLGNKRSELVISAARQLAKVNMVRFDEMSNSFVISDLGRIAARYYLRHQTVEVFNEHFNPRMKNADIIAMLAQATEFAQIQLRDNEIDELTNIMSSDNCPMEVKGGATSAQGKVNILLQAHISKVFIEDFALVSDAAYVAQNAGRIIRALLEIALSRNWANCALLLIDLSKAIERRMWPYEHPLGQIGSLQRETLYNLRRWADDTEINELREMDPKEIGEMVHMNTHHGTALHNAAMMFPTIGVTHALRPLAHDLLQITVTVKPEFVWNTKLSGSSEPFYVWVQDAEGLHILQWRSILLRQSTSSLDIEFVIPWTPGEHESLSIVTASDRWLGSDSQAAVSLSGLVMPPRFEDTTPLLDLPFLPITALDDPALVSAYRPHVPMLNCIQTQAFWSIYHTNHSVLVSAPVSSGKSLLGELAIWHAFKHAPVGLALVLVPSARAASETAARIRGVAKGTAVTHVRSADALETAVTADGQRVVVATPGALATFTPKQLYDLGHKLTVVVLEDLHHLDALYELAVTKLLSVTRAARTRLVGLTCSLADPSDLASWLGIDPTYAFAFTPRDRGSPLVVQLKTFSIPHSATLLKTMVKPTYDIVKGATGPVVVFVPSRAAARSAATDMVTQSGTAMDLNGFLQADRADVEPLLTRLVDSSLLEPILHGIGYVLPRMAASDLALVLELFASGILKALVAPRDAAWTLPVRASTVVLMGAQYVRFDPATDERTVCNYPRADLVRMQGFAVQSAHPATPGGRMFVMCQPEQQVGIARTLGDGLPLESGLPAVLRRDVNAHVNGDRDRDRNRNRDASLALTALDSMLPMRPAPPPPSAHRPPVQSDLRARDLSDLLGWTYFGRRARASPSYYDIEGPDSVSRLVDAWFAGKEREEREKVKEVERKEREKGKGKKADKMNEKGKEKEEVAEPGVDADGDANADADAGGHDGEADPRSVAPPADGHEYIIEEIEVHADTDSDSD